MLVAFTAAAAVAIYYLGFKSEEQVINIKNADDHHQYHYVTHNTDSIIARIIIKTASQQTHSSIFVPSPP